MNSSPSNDPGSDTSTGASGSGGPSPTRRTEKVSEVVARAIAQDIATRELPPGTRLPSESQMLARYEVGRASLREGLRILEVHGLITIKPGPGGGPVVAATNSENFGRMSTLHYQGARATYRDIVEARKIIEPLMARLAAERRDPEELEALRGIARRTAEGLDDPMEYVTGAAGFHALLSTASGNRVLNLFARSIQDVYTARISGFLFPANARAEVQEDHEEIIAAIEAGDGERAEALMRAHMDDFARLAVERYPGMLDEMVDWH